MLADPAHEVSRVTLEREREVAEHLATEAMLRRMTNEQRANGALRVTLPYSEVCCHMRVAGETRLVIPLASGMAQILNDDGSLFSFPVTRGEAGLPYYHGVR